MFIVIACFTLILLLGTTTYAFFNYTRTGSTNTIKVGRIAFNSEQGNAINLTNVFPIDKANIDTETDYVGSVSIHVTGDTTYSEGIEYLVKAVNVNNTAGSYKKIPISVDVSYTATDNKVIGTPDKNYFDNRGGNTSIYKILAGKQIAEGNNLVVGYIAPNETGIDGTITIKAFIDKDRIAISDTPEENYSETFGSDEYELNPDATPENINACAQYMENYYIAHDYTGYLYSGETYDSFCAGTGTLEGVNILEMLYDGWFSKSVIDDLKGMHIIIQTSEKTVNSWKDGSPSEWVNGRTVFTTEEWNSLETNGISFQVKVEANEGIWVERQGNALMDIHYSDLFYKSDKVKEIYFNSMSSTDMHNAYDQAEIKFDVTYNNEGEVLAWYVPDTVESDKYILYIVSDGTTYFTTGVNMFYGYSNVEKIVFNNVDTSRVTDMLDMFYRCEKLKELDLSSFDTSNVTNMGYLVAGATSLERINLSGLDMGKVRGMYYMFASCYNLEEINFTGSYTRDLQYVSSMFEGVTKVEYLDLSNFGGDNLGNLDSWHIGEIDNLKTLVMRNFNFGNANFNSAFAGADNLETIDFTGANFSNIQSVPKFRGSPKLTTIIVSEGVDFSSITNGDANVMFNGCTSLVGGNGTTYDPDHVGSSYAKIDGGESNPGYFTLSNQ